MDHAWHWRLGHFVRSTNRHLRTRHFQYRNKSSDDHGKLSCPEPLYDSITDIIQPPFTLVFVILCSLAYLIHIGRLSPWIAGLAVEFTQIICYILLITVKNAIAKYIFVMIATAASQSFFALMWPERIRAAKGTTTAGLAIGITNASCQLMGIVGPQIYQLKFGPTYRVSYCCSIGLLSACLAAVCTSWFFVRRGDLKEARKVGGNFA